MQGRQQLAPPAFGTALNMSGWQQQCGGCSGWTLLLKVRCLHMVGQAAACGWQHVGTTTASEYLP
jgi:hypothetical protein